MQIITMKKNTIGSKDRILSRGNDDGEDDDDDDDVTTTVLTNIMKTLLLNRMSGSEEDISEKNEISKLLNEEEHIEFKISHEIFHVLVKKYPTKDMKMLAAEERDSKSYKGTNFVYGTTTLSFSPTRTHTHTNMLMNYRRKQSIQYRRAEICSFRVDLENDREKIRIESRRYVCRSRIRKRKSMFRCCFASSLYKNNRNRDFGESVE